MNMSIKFSYWEMSKYSNNSHLSSIKIRRAFEMLDAPGNIGLAYSQYLLSSLDSDFLENRFGACDELLIEIEKIERGEIEYFDFEYDGFIHHVNKKSVTFEHAIFGICPHWPLWSCPFSHYKIAVQTARDFYSMPESLDTQLIVELPETDMAKISLFPPKLAENKTAFGEEHNH
jgi:hypothetical protein